MFSLHSQIVRPKSAHIHPQVVFCWKHRPHCPTVPLKFKWCLTRMSRSVNLLDSTSKSCRACHILFAPVMYSMLFLSSFILKKDNFFSYLARKPICFWILHPIKHERLLKFLFMWVSITPSCPPPILVMHVRSAQPLPWPVPPVFKGALMVDRLETSLVNSSVTDVSFLKFVTVLTRHAFPIAKNKGSSFTVILHSFPIFIGGKYLLRYCT